MKKIINLILNTKLFNLKLNKNTESLYDESVIMNLFGIQKFKKILIISFNKKELIKDYILNNQYEYLNVFDPSLRGLDASENVLLNSFLPINGDNFDKYYAKSEYDLNATFFKKDLRWISYNNDIEYKPIKKSGNIINENYDLLFLALNGSELSYMENIGNLKDRIKIVKFQFSKFNVDSRTYLKDYFMFFYEKEFISFKLSNKKLTRIQKYNTSLENDFEEIYYFVNKKFLTKINFKSSFEYKLENYVDKEIIE